jgi:ABC-type polysaccharide/polyol phosphate export permease
VSGNEAAIDVLRWGNPLTPLVESVHQVAFFGQWPSVGQLVYVAVATVVSAIVGILVFQRLEPEMAVEL